VRALAAAALLAALAACASPEPPKDTGGPKIGVVVLHGEGDDPYGQTLRFTRTLIRDGFLTDSPEMPWSARRSHEAGAAATLKEIDASLARLKSRGAEKVFVAGHSEGAAAALRYAKERRLDGLIALAPAGAMNAAAIRPGTPVLWVVGDTEYPAVRKVEQAALEALPRSPPPTLVEVAAGHLDTPDAAGAVCAKWMREIARAERK
jgi:dienelactone hydrolase